MHKPNAAEISYGTIGQALYYTDLKRWEFTRDPDHDRQELRAIGIDCVAIKPTSSASQVSVARVHESRQRKFLSTKYPEITPAIPLLLEVAKGEIDPISGQGAAHFGNRLSSGRALDVDNRKTKSTYRLFAVPDGDHGEDLKIYLARVEYYGWRRDNRSCLAIPCIQSSEPGWWHGSGGPIQQICFAPSIDNQSTLLAIRSFASIHILKPLYRRRPTARPEGPAKYLSFLESCIDANQLLSVTCHAEPQSVFVHFSFNPWYKRQFVVIDSNGNWAIYEINGKANSSRGYQALQVERNRLSKPEGRDKNPPLEVGDIEWARIFWIKDVNMIVASSRLSMTVFDMKQSSVSSHDLNLGLGPNDIVLDVQLCSEINDFIIILTSSVISIVRIDRATQPSKSLDPHFTGVRMEMLHSWKHKRDCRDRSLRFCHTIDDESIKVILYSSSKCLLSLHTFLVPQDEFSVPAAVLDPVELQYSATMSKNARENFILDIMIEPLLRENSAKKFSFQTHLPAYPNSSARFYILIILWDNHSVTESVHYLNSKRGDIFVERPSLVKRGPLSTTRVGRLDDVMVDDEHNRQLAIGIRSNERKLVPYNRKSSSRKLGKKAVPHIANLGQILHHELDICDSLDNLTKLIRNISFDEIYMGTTLSWFHHIGDKFRVHDIDEASQVLEDAALQNYRDGRGSETSTITSQIISPYLKFFRGNDGVMRLSTVYEHIVAQWLAHLPDDVPSKVRMSKEKLARQIAAEVCLASMVLRSDGQADGDEDEQRSTEISKLESSIVQTTPQANSDERKQISDDMVKHSYRGPRLSMHDRVIVELETSDNALLPTPSATPSVMSSSSASSAKPLHCIALNRYGYSPSTQTLPKALSRCLDTWNLDENPYSFDGDVAIQAVIKTSDADDDNEYGMSASERRRFQRRAERLLKRQRRQAAKSTETMTATDNLISLQLRPANFLQSSQVTGDGTTIPAATATGPSSSQAVPTVISRFTLSSQMPSSSQNMEKARSSGMQSSEGTAKKRRRLAGF